MRLPAAIATLVVTTTAPGLAQECPPIAVVEGATDLATRIREELQARGTETSPAASCPKVTARVTRAGELLRLRMQDDWGRTSEREVRDVATATALIDSFTRQEVLDRVLALPPEPAPAPAEADTSAAAAATAATPLVAGITLGMESALADDGSMWVGGALAACVRIGPICAGGLVRAATETGWTTQTAHDRFGIDLAAVAAWPLDLGGFVFSPAVVAGVGWTRTTTTTIHMPDAHTMVVEEDVRDGGGLRLGAQATVGRGLGGGFVLELGLGADAALLRGEGEPAGFGRAGLGLRWGGW